MGAKTGNPRGRPKGAKSKRTVELEQAMETSAKAIESALPDAFTGDAHSLLMTVYKNPLQEWNIRVDAAKAAIRYEKPALASTELKADVRMSHEDWLEQLPDDEPGGD